MPGLACRWLAGCVEGVEVLRRGKRKFLNLALAHLLAAGAFHRLDSGVEGAPGGLDRRHATEPVRVALLRQVEHGVGRVEVLLTPPAVGDAVHLNLAEDGGQGPPVGGLRATPWHPLGVNDLVDPRLSVGPEVQVVLVELAQQRPAPLLHGIFELTMAERRCLGTLQEGNQRVEDLPGAKEGRGRGGFGAHRHDSALRPVPRRATSAARPASPRASSFSRSAR
ncbi:MAG: hypothetical protein QOD01_1181 [Actinomycetota bacterium]|nr:hypothetical protein [Actinomycetota bacterium]